MDENKLIIIEANDWVAVYKNNNKVWSGHTIDQFGNQTVTNIWDFCIEELIDRKNVIEAWIAPEDEEFLEMGDLPEKFDKLKGKYI